MKTCGITEKIIGTWLKKSGKRDEVVLASKIAGPNPNFIRDTIDFSLKVYSMPR
jgi:aryl-alcohol dehydrogenase-like predicted oxidoreductase